MIDFRCFSLSVDSMRSRVDHCQKLVSRFGLARAFGSRSYPPVASIPNMSLISAGVRDSENTRNVANVSTIIYLHEILSVMASSPENITIQLSGAAQPRPVSAANTLKRLVRYRDSSIPLSMFAPDFSSAKIVNQDVCQRGRGCDTPTEPGQPARSIGRRLKQQRMRGQLLIYEPHDNADHNQNCGHNLYRLLQCHSQYLTFRFSGGARAPSAATDG